MAWIRKKVCKIVKVKLVDYKFWWRCGFVLIENQKAEIHQALPSQFTQLADIFIRKWLLKDLLENLEQGVYQRVNS